MDNKKLRDVIRGCGISVTGALLVVSGVVTGGLGLAVGGLLVFVGLYYMLKEVFIENSGEYEEEPPPPQEPPAEEQ